MLSRVFLQRSFLSSSVQTFSTTASAVQTVDKESLVQLRKRTGYSYVNCRKALLQFGPNKLDEAEKWLRELAAKEGWAKAAKLSSRATTQGLVGISASGNHAAIVELSCETDFVARGENFKELLDQLTQAVLARASREEEQPTEKIRIVEYGLDSLKNIEGKSLKEITTLFVGKLGENLNVKSLKAYYAPEGTLLYGSSHPRDGTANVSMGRFVSIVALRRTQQGFSFPSEKLAAQLCQHVIGMRPEKLGEKPTVVGEKLKNNTEQGTENTDDLNAFAKVESTHLDDSEDSLLKQTFMLNPSQTVHEYLTSHHAEVVDFIRVELGTGQN